MPKGETTVSKVRSQPAFTIDAILCAWPRADPFRVCMVARCVKFPLLPPPPLLDRFCATGPVTVHFRRWVAARSVCSRTPPQPSTRFCAPGSRPSNLWMTVGGRCGQLSPPPPPPQPLTRFCAPGLDPVHLRWCVAARSPSQRLKRCCGPDPYPVNLKVVWPSVASNVRSRHPRQLSASQWVLQLLGSWLAMNLQTWDNGTSNGALAASIGMLDSTSEHHSN